ncbi:Mitotic spindle checkpoint protein BUB3, WD repeat superfamily [Phaffia rhodozyma]|uniref:Mitotic spindle checkpoint protein BUB3, WD repeat superfamily n=1 Tax=Phaffia rhodozyma TaxID=264483 RepID=A0A0F7SLT9_PHARH|nr:Mitotic spindle checkpoint protein BUB3, WD repeat superfamily [Phaffia rhodozyma]
MPESTDISLPLPADTIASLAFSPDSSRLAVASWDSTLTVHEIDPSGSSSSQIFKHEAPVLAACFSTSTEVFSGGIDHHLRSWDLETGSPTVLDVTEAEINQLSWASSSNVLLATTLSSQLNTYDPRLSSPLLSSLRLPQKTVAMDTSGNNLVLALGERMVYVYDVRKLGSAVSNTEGEPEQRRESALKFLTRSLACMTDGKGWASSSIDGRIAVEYFAPEDQAQKYAYKAHRVTSSDKTDHAHPISALAFHPTLNTFASAGSDHSVSIWDHVSKRRVKQLAHFPNAVSSLAFSPDGSWLAVGYGDGLGENMDEQTWSARQSARTEESSCGERGVILKRQSNEKEREKKPRPVAHRVGE